MTPDGGGSGGAGGAGGAPPSDAGSNDACTARIVKLMTDPNAKAFPQSECSAVVHLDYQTFLPLGHMIVCAPPLPVSAMSAFAGCHNVVGYDNSGAVQVADSRLASQGGDQLFVWFDKPHDEGSMCVTNALSASLLFAGTTWFGGRGDIVYPKEGVSVGVDVSSWNTMSDVNVGCYGATAAEVGSPDALRARALTIQVPTTSADVASALKLVWDTGIPAALVHGSPRHLRNAVVVDYARTAGGPDMASAERIVIVNAGAI
jgi:hypothetical protein